MPIREVGHGVEFVDDNLAVEMLTQRLDAGDRVTYFTADGIVVEETGPEEIAGWPYERGFSGSADEMARLLDVIVARVGSDEVEALFENARIVNADDFQRAMARVA